MTIYKNDRRHFTKAYATADEAAINWKELEARKFAEQWLAAWALQRTLTHF